MWNRVRELPECLADERSGRRRWALATLVEAEGSHPVERGTAMLVSDDGLVRGSLSGGCLEAVVVARAEAALAEGGWSLQQHGPGRDLVDGATTCGGTLTVLVQPLAEIAGVDALGEAPERLVLSPGAISTSGTGTWTFTRPSPRLVVVGATEIGAELCALAETTGWATTCLDARPLFATSARVPRARAVVCDVPARWLTAKAAAGRLGAGDAVCLLTHDPKFDLAALEVALRLDLAFVGALGSRATVARRRQDLRAGGLDEAALARLHSPLGLDLGAVTPAEVAVSIVAQLVAVRRGRSSSAVEPLSGGTRPVHAGVAAWI